ncbi:hypothetical protein ACIBH1_14610 [Nonomuraea sp. NPDC050663]|uniref:hypothetical protein n=1 Tax=Nonomuraea sp. NPDC050663 TaxID=3364370 RepID=UPI0037A55630
MQQTFDQLLKAAIDARGLSLERLHARLRQRGIDVSLASLSNWQRGKCRPERSHSLRAVHALEEILALPGDSLVASLGPPRPRGRRLGGALPYQDLCLVGGSIQRLLAEVRHERDGQLDTLSYHDHVTLGPDRDERSVRTRAVFQARSDGVDRHVAVYHNERGRLPDEITASCCRAGRTRTDADEGIAVVELLFDRPLSAGETYVVEYEVRFDPPGPPAHYYERWFRFPAHSYLLTVQFDRAAPPARVTRVRQANVRRAPDEVSELRLGGWNTAHIAGVAVEPGVHGMRWEWS